MSGQPYEAIGVLIPTTTAPADLTEMGRYAEDAGYGEVWVAEDYFFLGGIASAGLVLQATNNVKVGIGVLSSVVRHPAVTAMEIATLANAHPGRLLPAIGHGVPAWTKQMGLYPGSPLGTFREVITSIRRLLNGEVLSEGEGHYYFDGVGLTHPVAGVPLLGGVVGPKSLELSGEVADGTVMSMLAGAKYVEFAKSCALMGARRAGRSEDHLLPTFTIFSVDEDGARAKEAVRDVVAFYLAAVGPTALTGCYDANDQLADMVGRGGAEIIAKEMPDEWLDAFAVAGDPSECAAKIDALRAAGATSVVLVPTPSTEGTRLVGEAAQSVLPLLGR